MSSAACGQPLSLTQIPTDRVVRLVGLTDEQLTVSLDPLPADAPAVLRYSADHRGSLEHAADPRRDNGLTLDGVVVLRFTNEEILDDPLHVLAVIHSLLSKKRHDEGNLP